MGKSIFLVLSLVIALNGRRAISQLASCATNGQSDCSDNEAGSNCDAGTNLCVCNTLNAEATNDCSEKSCTLADIVATTCGTSTTCEASPDAYKCLCIANYSPTTSTGCTQTVCTDTAPCSADSACTASKCVCAAGFTASGSICKKDCTLNNDCHASAACVNGVCECNVNFEGSGATCAPITGCAAGDLTKCHPDSKCDVANSNTCVCKDGWEPDGTVCKETCTAASTCAATNAGCVSLKCECNVNYAGDGGSTCTQKICSGTDVANCDENSKCASDLCECADGWVTDGTVCKKTCSDSSTCDSNAGCVSSKCECNVNYAGDGGNTCTQKICSDNDATFCDENSKCMANKCVCADNFVDTSGTSCVCPASVFIVVGTECKKVCTVGAAESGCGTNAVCISDKCECAINFEGNAATACTQKVCTVTNTSTCDANSKCLSDLCNCADNFVASDTTCSCSTTGFTLVGTACKKDCTADSDCGTNALCVSSKCECSVNFEGNAADACTQKACSGTNNSTCDSNSVCETSKCECAVGYKAATDKIECENSGANLCNNFTLLMAAVLMLFFTSNTY